MARNSEKAQSMLYRFREQQAVEMGIGNRIKGDRRPRMASAVSSLRECERWRGDLLRDISRKVSKIQDVTLTDYEIRDLNDEINSLMREKRHWETQIVNLGGANYKRAQTSMTDDAGKEVPGTRGYKYFGRAKELPGVKDLLERGAQNANEESARNASFQMFRNQGPDYYGDVDEMDEKLAQEEEELAKEDWEEAVRETAEILALPEVPDIPFPGNKVSSNPAGEGTSNGPISVAKRKANGDGDGDGDEAMKGDKEEVVVVGEEVPEGSKKAKMNGTNGDNGAAVGGEAIDAAGAAARQAALAASFFGMLDPMSLQPPKLPTTEEMGNILLEVRKRALREEYGV